MLGEEEVSGEGTGTPRLSAGEKRSVRPSRVGERTQNCGCLLDLTSLFLWLSLQIQLLDLYDSVDAPQLLPFTLTQNTLTGNL